MVGLNVINKMQYRPCECYHDSGQNVGDNFLSFFRKIGVPYFGHRNLATLLRRTGRFLEARRSFNKWSSTCALSFQVFRKATDNISQMYNCFAKWTHAVQVSLSLSCLAALNPCAEFGKTFNWPLNIVPNVSAFVAVFNHRRRSAWVASGSTSLTWKKPTLLWSSWNACWRLWK